MRRPGKLSRVEVLQHPDGETVRLVLEAKDWTAWHAMSPSWWEEDGRYMTGVRLTRNDLKKVWEALDRVFGPQKPARVERVKTSRVELEFAPTWNSKGSDEPAQ